MSFDNKRLDAALDRQLTQTPEEYYGTEEDEDGNLAEDQMLKEEKETEEKQEKEIQEEIIKEETGEAEGKSEETPEEPKKVNSKMQLLKWTLYGLGAILIFAAIARFFGRVFI